jgi:hypothetical protein
VVTMPQMVENGDETRHATDEPTWNKARQAALRVFQRLTQQEANLRACKAGHLDADKLVAGAHSLSRAANAAKRVLRNLEQQ